MPLPRSSVRLGTAAVLFAALVQLVAAATYTQSGSCYDYYGYTVKSCDDVAVYCNSKTCSSSNGLITYTCYNWRGSTHCTGTATLSTPAPTAAFAGSNNCINGRNLQLTTCADTSSFNDIGCTCFKCSEVNGHIALSCSAPFTCSNDFDGPNAASDEPAPELNITNYVVIFVVFIGVSVLFAALAWWKKPKLPEDPTAPKLTWLQQLRAFISPANLVAFGMKQAWDAFSSFVIEPNMRSDGTKTTTCEFWASSNVWVALMSRIRCCCCCCARPRQPPPNYKPPMPIGSALYELLGDTIITFSLSFLVGTVVNNSDACSTRIIGDDCKNGVTTISTSGSITMTNGDCQSIDMDKAIGAVICTIVLTKIVAAACGYAEGTAKDDAKRKAVILAGGIVVRLALLGFGIGYSFALATQSSGSEAAKKRYSTIGAVLGSSWAAEQVEGMFEVLLQRVGVLVVCIAPPSVKALKADQVINSVVHPSVYPTHLQPPVGSAGVGPTDVELKVVNTSAPSAPSLNAMVYETDATKATNTSGT